MGSPAIFAGKRSKLLSNKGLLNSNGSINDYNGDINYILNGHAEVNTAGWATYADAAQATPVNGTGGSPSVTWTQTTTSPLDDLASFVFTKDAVNRQGQGVSYDFTIDSASQAKVLTVSFDYIVGSGTFVAGSSSVDSDLEVYLYDVTNSVLIQPSTYKLYSNSSTVAAKFVSNFQTPYNSTSYRLIFHCATTSASAYTVKFDNVVVSPSQYVYGTPITDWASYTPANQGFGTLSAVDVLWRRVGGNLEISGKLTTGTATAVEARLYFPTSNVSLTFSQGIRGAGYWFIGTSVTSHGGQVLIESGVNYLTFSDISAFSGGAGNPLAKANGNAVNSGNPMTLFASVPILGWSSSVQMSDNAAQNIVSAKYTGNNAATSGNPIIGQTLQWDTSGSYSTSTGKFTVPVAGYYQVTMMYNNTANLTYTVYLDAVSKEIISLPNASGFNQGTSTIYCNAGQTLDVRPSGTMGATAGSSNQAWVTYTKVTGPNSIGATETVAASYWLSANFAASATVPINFDSREYDYTGSVTTSATAWRFTAPVAGLYNLCAYINNSAGSGIYYGIYKNGTLLKGLSQNGTSGSLATSNNVRLLAGDYIDVRPASASTSIGGVLGNINTSNIAIAKIGNY